MLRKLFPLVVLGASALAVAQNAPPAGGPPGGAPGGGMRMDPAERFKSLDKNNDGKLSQDEFAAMQQMRMGGAGGPPPGGAGGPPPGAAGNGPPAGAAPPQGGGRMGNMMSSADRFKSMDKNNDGSISLEEFTQGMQNMRGPGGPPGQ